LKAEVDTLTREKATLKTEVETLGRETEKLGKTSADYDRLREEIKGKRDLLDGLSKELATLEIELREDVPRRATRLGEPFLEKRDCKRQLMAAGGVPVVVLVVSCFGVGWWECRKRRICSAAEVGGLGMRVVGAVP